MFSDRVSDAACVPCHSFAEPSIIWQNFTSHRVISGISNYCISCVVHSSGQWRYVITSLKKVL